MQPAQNLTIHNTSANDSSSSLRARKSRREAFPAAGRAAIWADGSSPQSNATNFTHTGDATSSTCPVGVSFPVFASILKITMLSDF
jgi:hypothetical protein